MKGAAAVEARRRAMARAMAIAAAAIAAVALIVLALTRAWSGGEGGGGVASLEADAARLQELRGDDPARTVLREIDRAVDTERPVMAAELIDQAGLPMTREQIERLQQASMTTREGRALRSRAVRIHRARAAALEQYRDALARGIGTEDEALLEAMHAYAEAELDLVTLDQDLARIRPLGAAAGERSDREARLGGLPPLHGAGAEPGDAPPALPSEGPDPRLGEPQEPLPE